MFSKPIGMLEHQSNDVDISLIDEVVEVIGCMKKEFSEHPSIEEALTLVQKLYPPLPVGKGHGELAPASESTTVSEVINGLKGLTP